MNAKLVYLTGGSFVSLLFGIIVTIILPAQEPAGPTELAKPYSEQEARGRDIYLREGCHYCHTQQVRAPEANRGFVRARGDIGPESVPGDFYYQSPVFWGTLRQGTDLTHVASREGVGSNASWHERHFRNPRSMSPGSVKTAHRIVAKAVNAAENHDQDELSAKLLDEAAEAVIGRKLELSPETIAETLDPDAIVRTRSGPGGAAESSIEEMIASCRGELKTHSDWRRQRETNIDESQSRLLAKAGPMKREPQTEGSAPPLKKKRSLSDFEKEFEGLPKMPRGRRPWER